MRIRLGQGDDGLFQLADRVEAFAERHALAPAVRRDLHLAVDECVNNIVRHAQPRHPAVTVDMTVAAGTLQIRIVDDGEAFDPKSRPAPDTTLSLAERPVGGLGIYLVRQLMTDVQYRRVRGRNHLTLRRRLDAVPPAAI
jgi:serine/threonine-protein kinase RsbW